MRYMLQFFVTINSYLYVRYIKAYVLTPNNNFSQCTYLHTFSVYVYYTLFVNRKTLSEATMTRYVHISRHKCTLRSSVSSGICLMPLIRLIRIQANICLVVKGFYYKQPTRLQCPHCNNLYPLYSHATGIKLPIIYRVRFPYIG